MSILPEKLAPIVISVYTRLDHFKKCILSLQENDLACESELFIYSDAASSPLDVESVAKVRDFSRSIVGFKRVTLINRDKNYGGARNAEDGQKEVLVRYGSSIFMEDDIVVSKSFLKFMNDALFLYKNDPLIHSVSGFNIPNVSSEDGIILSKLFSGWGVGMWAHKEPYSSVESMITPHQDMIENKIKSKVKKYHPTLHKNLKKVDNKICRANDVIFTYLLIKCDLFQIKPTQSLVRNMGMDNSGVNCGSDRRFLSTKISNTELNPGALPKYKLQFDREYYDFFYPVLSLYDRLINLYSKIYRKLLNVN